MAFFVHLRGESSRQIVDSKPENGFFGGIRQLLNVYNILIVNRLHITRLRFKRVRRCFGLLAGAKSARQPELCVGPGGR